MFYEDFTPEQSDAFRKRIAVLKAFSPPKGDSPVDELIRWQYRCDLLEIGAPGKLLMAGEIDDVVPIEEAGVFEGANPVKDVKVVYDRAAIERREDAMVRALKDGGVVVLGSDHDLADNTGPEYVRVELK